MLLFFKARDVLKLINDKRGPIDNLEHEVIGKTRVLIDGDSKNCRRQECNMGNLICDAIIDYVNFLINYQWIFLSLPLYLTISLFFALQYAGEYLSKDGWTNAAIVMLNSGNIRGSITRARNDEVIIYAHLSFTKSFHFHSQTLTGHPERHYKRFALRKCRC